MKVKEIVKSGLICVVCQESVEPLSTAEGTIVCDNCKTSYPIVNGIPILINEEKSIFSFSDFTAARNLFFDISVKGKFLAKVGKLMPNLGGNNVGKKNFRFLELLLLKNNNYKPKILIVGGSIVGEGMEDFVNSNRLEFVEGDVSFGLRTKIIFDAHSIPYADETFDSVIIQAVLEHVIDPSKCVKEIHRVLKPNALVYAETPFMQQVHGGPYDFTRFTRSGHRKLFSQFEEVKSGPSAGTATSFAWSYQYFLLALFGYTKGLRLLIKVFARLTGFWIKYFDRLTALNVRDSDGASGFYFIGAKSESKIPDIDIIKYYK